jgi:glycosyltransferase involved in cell wall biosynthesis
VAVSTRAEGPLRVGLVIGQLTGGGAEGQLRLLCEGLDRTAVRPFVYCLSTKVDPHGPLLARADVPVRIVAGTRLGRVLELRHALAADAIDVVHAWLFIGNAYAWAATLGARGRPLITSARNCKRQGRWLDALNRRAFRASRAIIVNSADVEAYIVREYGAPAARIRVVPNAIDLRRFQPQARTGGGPRIITVGRLVGQKNPLRFVTAAAALRARLPDARFTIVGDGPLRSAVESAIRSAGLEGACRLTGERHDIETLLGDADVFWLTSDWEGMPNVVIEALACGLPVVASRVGGTADLIADGEQGFLVTPDDVAAVVARSVEILTDPALYAHMRAAARARAEAFGVGRMVRAMCAAYEHEAARLAA